MKNLVLFLFLFSFGMMSAQYNTDTPWMVEYYKNKSLNRSSTKSDSQKLTFKEVQKAFNSYWETRDPNVKGSGYKPFKRWEKDWEAALNSNGQLPKAKGILQTIQNHQKLIKKDTTTFSGKWKQFGVDTLTNTGSWNSGRARTNAIAVDPKDPSIWYVGTPAGGLWKYGNVTEEINGKEITTVKWKVLTDSLPSIGVSGIAIDHSDSKTIYIATGDDDASGDALTIGVWKTEDGGKIWEESALVTETETDPNPVYPSRMNEIYMHPLDSETLWVATDIGVFKTIDAGITWEKTLSGNVKDIRLKPGDPTVMYAVTHTQFFKSTDGGDTFVQIAVDTLINSQRMVIEVTKANPEYVYLLSAYPTYFNKETFRTEYKDGGILYRSMDSGVTFKEQKTGTNLFQNRQISYNLALGVSTTNAEELYVGTMNILKSIDGGKTYNQLNHWFQPAVDINTPNSYDPKYDPAYTHADIHTIRTFGSAVFVCSDGGIYISKDGGATFVDKTKGIRASQFYKIAVAPDNPNKMVGGLQDNGGYGYNTNNEGKGWLNYHGADGMDNAIDPTNDSMYYGMQQNGNYLYISDKSGEKRSSMVQGPQPPGNWVTPIAINSKGKLFAGYQNLYCLNDERTGWDKLAFLGASADLIEIAPSDDNVMYIAVGTTLFMSIDEGKTVAVSKRFTSEIQGIAIHKVKPDRLWVTTAKTVVMSTDGGKTFTDIYKGLPELGINPYFHMTDIVYHAGKTDADDTIYLGTSVGVYRKVGAKSWAHFSTDYPGFKIKDLEISGTTITAATYGRGIWRSSLVDPDSDTTSCDITANQQYTIDNGTVQQGELLAVCTGQSVVLKMNVLTGDNPTFAWSGPNGYSSNGSSITLNNLSVNQAGRYNVTISAGDDCVAMDYTFVVDAEGANIPDISNQLYYNINGAMYSSIPSGGIEVTQGEQLNLWIAAAAVNSNATVTWTNPSGENLHGEMVGAFIDQNSQSGVYTAAVTFNSNCGVVTQTYPVTVNIMTPQPVYTQWPNPTYGIFYIDNTISFVNPSIEVYNFYGQRLPIGATILDKQIQVNLWGYYPGIYFVRVWDNGKYYDIKITKL